MLVPQRFLTTSLHRTTTGSRDGCGVRIYTKQSSCQPLEHDHWSVGHAVKHGAIAGLQQKHDPGSRYLRGSGPKEKSRFHHNIFGQAFSATLASNAEDKEIPAAYRHIQSLAAHWPGWSSSNTPSCHCARAARCRKWIASHTMDSTLPARTGAPFRWHQRWTCLQLAANLPVRAVAWRTLPDRPCPASKLTNRPVDSQQRRFSRLSDLCRSRG